MLLQILDLRNMLLCLFLAMVLLMICYVVYTHFLDGLSHIPAIHWSTKWSRCHLLWTKYSHSTKLIYYDAHINGNGKHGSRPLVRVAPSEVSIMTSEGVRVVWGGDYERSSWYEVFFNYGYVVRQSLLSQTWLIRKLTIRVCNMFSCQSSKAHRERRRIFATAYSKTAVSQPSVQILIKQRMAKLLRYLDQQTNPEFAKSDPSSPVVVRHVFRALQADIFTAFVFSATEGTTFLDKLGGGPDTMEELDMRVIHLGHEDRRDAYFFWESEKPFKHIKYLLNRSGLKAHKKAEAWLKELAREYESNLSIEVTTEFADQKLRLMEQSPYRKICLWKDSNTGRGLTFNERASEILDHIIAGQDPVPAALEFIVKQLSIHEDIQSCLHAELLGSMGLLAKGYGSAIVDNLAYLDCIVMESLRLIDNISSYQTRIVPPGGCLILGCFLPGGVSNHSVFWILRTSLCQR